MTPDEKLILLREELLVDPLVLAPGPDLSPIKPLYRLIIEQSIANFNAKYPAEPKAYYGPYTDQILSNHFGAIEAGTRPVDITAGELRQPLLRGNWGKIDLIASQLPEYYGLPTSADAQVNKFRDHVHAERKKRERMHGKVIPEPTAPTQTPILSVIIPDNAKAADPDFTMHYHGQNFVEFGADKSVAVWDGVAQPTTFVSATELTSYVRSTVVTAATTCQILINSGGRMSAPLTFTYYAPAPAGDVKVKRTVYCRNLMILLQDPVTVHRGDRYGTIRDTLDYLVGEDIISGFEAAEILGLMLGGPVTHAYSRNLVGDPKETVTAAEINVALRGPLPT